jgi:ABC-2 type transport system ATP-binding protein
MIAALARSGRHAIILATHVVETVPTVCSRAVLLGEGRIVRTWDAPELAASAAAPGGFEAVVMAALGQLLAA